MPFSVSNLYNSVARFGVLDFLKNLNRNSLIVYESTPTGLRSTTGVNRASGDRAFIIGFIPPDISINFVPVEKTGGELLGAVQVTVPSKKPKNFQGLAQTYEANMGNKSDAFWEKIIKSSDRLKVDPMVLVVALTNLSGLDGRSAAVEKVPPPGKGFNTIAVGLNQISKNNYKSVMDEATFNNFTTVTDINQISFVEKYLYSLKQSKWTSASQVFLASVSPDAVKYYKDPNYVIYSGAKGSPTASFYKANVLLDYNKDGKITVSDINFSMRESTNWSWFNIASEKIKEAQQRITSGNPASAPVSTTGNGDPNVIQRIGIMSGSMKPEADFSDDPYSELGRYIQKDDKRLQNARKVVNDIAEQVKQIANTPSMLMYVNPRSFNRHYEQTVDVTGGWRGQIVSMWLEQPIKLSGSGTTAVQYAFDPQSGGGGISNVNRVFSLSYENLMSLSAFYRNNGWIYTGETYDASNVGVPTLACSIFIYYDGHIYIGSFDSFKIEEGVEAPFTMNYSFEFTARYDVPLMDNLGEASLAGARRL